jgi:hypothetical protein
MSVSVEIQSLILSEVDKLIDQAKQSLKEVKAVAISQAWKILQLAVASTVQIIENSATDLTGKDKKVIAMDLLSKFYDSVFIVIDIPFVPSLVEPIIHKYLKSFLMILVSSTIDAMVTTFRQTGVFVDPSVRVNAFVDVKPRVSDK